MHFWGILGGPWSWLEVQSQNLSRLKQECCNSVSNTWIEPALPSVLCGLEREAKLVLEWMACEAVLHHDRTICFLRTLRKHCGVKGQRWSFCQTDGRSVSPSLFQAANRYRECNLHVRHGRRTSRHEEKMSNKNNTNTHTSSVWWLVK